MYTQAQAASGRTLPAHVSLPFRPDIEGLRALAVLLVIAAHAGVPALVGGFIGVDIFFVLSGYLITGLLCKEVQVTGTIELRAFYARRLQRLMPALLLMVLVTALASAILLAPFEQPPQAAAGMAAAAWLSNFYFAFANIDYFGASAESNAFLHTWSLGVEEQFYLAWPLLLLFCLGLLRRKTGAPDWPQLWQGLLATLLISLLLSLLLTHQAPALAFYMAPARAWQFALGAIVLLATNHVDIPFLRTLRSHAFWTALAWLGVALLVAAATLFDKTVAYPGWRALVPSAGAALLLAAGQHAPSNQVSRLLSLRAPVSVGSMSYSLYLWHWPVLVLGSTLAGQSAAARAALVGVAVLLAWLSYRLVEGPIRRAPVLKARPVATLAGACLLIAGTTVAASQWRSALPAWAQDPGLTQYEASRRDLPAIYAQNCDEWFHSSRVRACYFGSESAPRTAVLLGDSIGAQWFSAVQGHFSDPDWRILVLTKSACPMVDLPIFYARIGRRYTECETWRAQALEYLAHIRPDVVIVGSAQSYAYTPDEWRDGSIPVLQRIRATTERVRLLAPVPTLDFDAPACEARKAWRRRWLPALSETCANEADTAALGRIHAALREAADATGTRLVDLNDIVCPGGICKGRQEAVLVYRDSQHLTDTFVRASQAAFDSAMTGTTIQ